jgi:hypothetical protein
MLPGARVGFPTFSKSSNVGYPSNRMNYRQDVGATLLAPKTNMLVFTVQLTELERHGWTPDFCK